MRRKQKHSKQANTIRGEHIPAVLAPLNQALVDELLAERGTVRDHLRRDIERQLGLPPTREEAAARAAEAPAPIVPAPAAARPTPRRRLRFSMFRKLTPALVQRHLFEWVVALLFAIELAYILIHTATERVLTL